MPVNTAQDAVGFPCCQGTQEACVLLAAWQDLHLLFSSAAPQLVSPQPMLVQGSLPSQVQNYAFALAAFRGSCCQSIPPAFLDLSGWQLCPQVY